MKMLIYRAWFRRLEGVVGGVGKGIVPRAKPNISSYLCGAQRCWNLGKQLLAVTEYKESLSLIKITLYSLFYVVPKNRSI